MRFMSKKNIMFVSLKGKNSKTGMIQSNRTRLEVCRAPNSLVIMCFLLLTRWLMI